MGLVTLAHFEAALRKAAEQDIEGALIGGLAVAAWSQHFGITPDDGSDAPFYSKDLDLRGDKPAAYLLGTILRDEGYAIAGITTVRRKDPPGLGRNFVVSVDMRELGIISVEVLEKMPLVDSPDLPPQGFALELAGIRILDPLSLTIGKIHAFNHRPTGLVNKDAVHLQLLARIVPRFTLPFRCLAETELAENRILDLTRFPPARASLLAQVDGDSAKSWVYRLLREFLFGTVDPGVVMHLIEYQNQLPLSREVFPENYLRRLAPELGAELEWYHDTDSSTVDFRRRFIRAILRPDLFDRYIRNTPEPVFTRHRRIRNELNEDQPGSADDKHFDYYLRLAAAGQRKGIFRCEASSARPISATRRSCGRLPFLRRGCGALRRRRIGPCGFGNCSQAARWHGYADIRRALDAWRGCRTANNFSPPRTTGRSSSGMRHQVKSFEHLKVIPPLSSLAHSTERGASPSPAPKMAN